jgi:hypothetical protein
LVSLITRAGSVKTVVKDELEEHVGQSYGVYEPVVEVWDGLLYSLGDVEVVPRLSEEETRTEDVMD